MNFPSGYSPEPFAPGDIVGILRNDNLSRPFLSILLLLFFYLLTDTRWLLSRVPQISQPRARRRWNWLAPFPAASDQNSPLLSPYVCLSTVYRQHPQYLPTLSSEKSFL
ncbi:hypothetical protein ASPZODRAFT_133584 [Penicilliopsis zonata CBS 506.65]|uniref:Uncharacterized protein n=1 Tax=Penicilliopsis zonata CBS 506.65 TaxID=1073090 RepID=A0A1L9SEV9_9EURO|nr:hypothetical protein ASPZODRAFT_133584 [Penicilliopsis zonata CBS 506.65]OJJ45721.1 hypothetical protein ASPZODRAFT_133584 [Penicilliopsis zonata CBS 506.65]